MTTADLAAIVESADELTDWMWKNSGNSADWPIEIRAHGDEYRLKMRSLFNTLEAALKPYRTERSKRTETKP